jgi:4-aminobutyrate aminotransferase/(S)-3-amino-2-methylpropionate transaminase
MFGSIRGRARSRGALRALAAVEAPEILDHASDFPIVLRAATGARVRDADGNRYVDLTSFFGAALVGHRNPAVVAAVRTQAGRLLHAMGDVHPADVRVRFLRELAARMPAPGYRAVLGLNGSDAVECALKFAAAATGRGGILSFEGAYHGLTGGALEATWAPVFREPFAATLSGRAAFAPWPAADGSDLDRVLDAARLALRDGAGGRAIGAVLVEPVQGRGGIRVPPPGFLPALAALARDAGAALIADEVYCGSGRTGAFLASPAEGVLPDAVCLGKALGGGVPISACLMRPALADAVRGTGVEAPHTSTFLGHPLGCAAGLAVLAVIDRRRLPAAALRMEATLRDRARRWHARWPASVGPARGRGGMIGVPMTGRTGAALAVVAVALKRGALILTEGPAADVLAFTPPLTIPPADLAFALDAVEAALVEVLG